MIHVSLSADSPALITVVGRMRLRHPWSISCHLRHRPTDMSLVAGTGCAVHACH